MQGKNLYLVCVLFTILFLTGADWPDNIEVVSGADFEKTRQLSYQDPPIKGPDVVELQERLKELGFYTGPIDGVYNRQVEFAVRDFQRDNNLRVDGIVRDFLWIRMADAIPITNNKEQKPESPQGTVSIIIDTYQLKLIVLDDNEFFQAFPVAIGRTSTPTPIGNFQVNHKAVNWGTGFGTRWMGLSVGWGKYGIHGTNKPWSIGRRASHGCIRMRNSDVEKLYPWVKIGTEVIIVGNPFGSFGHNQRTLVNGSRGADVKVVQEKLIRLGYLEGKADGIYGYNTEKAVKEFQKANNLKVTGHVGWNEYKTMDL